MFNANQSRLANIKDEGVSNSHSRITLPILKFHHCMLQDYLCNFFR